MNTTFILPPDTPENKKQVEDIISNLVSKGRSKQNPQAVRWWVANLYMQGYREFTNLDYNNGTVQVAYTDESGVLKFHFEQIVALYQAQLGRLMSINLNPAVNRKGVSLDGLKKSSVAQVALDAAFPQDKVTKLTQDACPPLLNYGTIGLALWVESPDSMGVDVVPPWEILPIPINVASPSEVRGLMRVRYVPKDWIRGLTITPGEKSKIYQGVESANLPVGNLPADILAKSEGVLSISSIGSSFFSQESGNEKFGNKKNKDKTTTEVTQLVEVWPQTSDGYLAEYLIFAGLTKLVQLYRHSFVEEKYHMPIRIVRDVTVGSFYGRSFVDQLIPLNSEAEYGLSSLFQAASDFDLYGILLWPNTLGVPTLAQRGADGVKVLRYEPDYSCPELGKPDHVEPAKMPAAQVQAVNTAIALMDKLANQPADLMRGRAPGRVDSSAGLGFLYETSGIPLSPTAKNLAEGVSGIYRAALRMMKDLWDDQKIVSLSQLDDNLAGIVLDAKTGDLSLSKNAIPYPDEVNVTVASEIPVSKEQQKMELKEALEKGRITLEEYSFEVRKKGLDLPVGLEANWHNYRRAMLENIILFGDGVSPGEVTVSAYDMPSVHLNVLLNFVARPEFFLASQRVREAFYKHIEEHKADQGVFPEQLPMPEDSAELELMAGQEGMPGMGPVPQ